MSEADKRDSSARAKNLGQSWDALAMQRLEASKRGEMSPWLGMKQWLLEVPLNAAMRGSTDAEAEAAIQDREQRFEQAMESAGQHPARPVPRVWNGVR